MNASKHIKFVFIFLVIAMSISCSLQKEVFLPEESAYTKKVRTILETDHYFCDTNYPIKLSDKPPFQKAYYRDSRELNSLMGTISSAFLPKYVTKGLNENIETKGYFIVFSDKEYFIISCDDEYIYIGFLKEDSTELYTKYAPIIKDNSNMHPIIKTRNSRKFHYWIVQEMNKGSIISITGNYRKWIAKSFNPM
jgi:hypothetical protein